MARLRLHETFGTSVNCKTLTPFAEGAGPTFTIHIFDTKQVSEAGNKVCAFEVWQRDADKKRKLVVSGESLEFADPTSDESIIQVTQAIAAQNQSPDFYSYSKIIIEEAAVRFTPRVKRPRRSRIVVETAETEVPTETNLLLVEAPSMEFTAEPAPSMEPPPKVHVHMDSILSTAAHA
jgi:hypothetical protein